MTRSGTTEPAESGPGGEARAGKSMAGSLSDRIVEGTRLALDPPGDARKDLIDAAISQLARRKRKLDQSPSRWEVALAGFLVGLAIFAFLVGRMTEVETAPVLLRALASVVGGAAVAAYLWSRDRRN